MPEDALMSAWGYMGKVPSKGDFLHSNVEFDFMASFQDWQQSIIAVSREQLGENWTPLFLNAPIWHFALNDTANTGQNYIGVLIPSVDSAGRYYFFSVIRVVSKPLSELAISRCWCDELEGIALKVLEDEFELEGWQQQLTEWKSKLDEIDHATTPVVQNGIESSSEIMPLEQWSSSAQIIERWAQQKNCAPSYWWTEGSERIEPTMVFTSGLPQVGQFAAMLDGNWKQWNW